MGSYASAKQILRIFMQINLFNEWRPGDLLNEVGKIIEVLEDILTMRCIVSSGRISKNANKS